MSKHQLHLPWRKGYYSCPMSMGPKRDIPYQQLVDADGEETLCIIDQGPSESSAERHEIIDAMLGVLNSRAGKRRARAEREWDDAVVEIKSLTAERDAFRAGVVAQADSAEQNLRVVCQGDAVIAELRAENARLTRERDEARKAGTPYAVERDAINALVIRVKELEAHERGK